MRALGRVIRGTTQIHLAGKVLFSESQNSYALTQHMRKTLLSRAGFEVFGSEGMGLGECSRRFAPSTDSLEGLFSTVFVTAFAFIRLRVL